MQNEIEVQRSILTPEMQEVVKSKQYIKKLQIEKDELCTAISSINQQLKDKQQHLLQLDDEILFQSFGLYTPQYDLANALDYKERLTEIRHLQKEYIKNNTAVAGSRNWTVEGSAAKGRKMICDMQKLLLRAFNTECDNIIAKVKYTNFNASLERIQKLAISISKLGKSLGIYIRDNYLKAKIKELHMAFEYQTKKQEEKEAARAAREEQREQAKLDDIDKALNDIDYRQANMRAGYVYVISNIGAFGENVYKIGMTRRLDPQDRVDELGDASVPFRFDVHAMIFSDDAPALETALHRAFEDKKLNMVNHRREFFNVTLDEIKQVVRENYDKTVEFKDVPDAEQYRISMKMREKLAYQ